MPASGEGVRSNRKGQYACDFCRTRKLRCDRPLPCTSCVSRGKDCRFGLAADQNSRPPPSNPDCAPTAPQQQPEQASRTHAATHRAPQSAALDQAGLLDEIQALRKLAQDLERRVAQSTGLLDENSGICLPSPASDLRVPVPDVGTTSVSGPDQMGEVVAHLERVSRDQSSQRSIYIEDLVLKIETVRNIPHAPIYTVRSGRPVRCVWLPRHDEARILVDLFIVRVSFIHHVVHHPSLPTVVDEIYQQIASQEPVKLGPVVLLLSIIASVVHVLMPHDDIDGRGSLSLSSAEANEQASWWTKATEDVLDAGRGCPVPALETTQGLVILSFTVCNLEGVSLRYRSMISNAIFLCQELGLHRIDHSSNSSGADTIRAEMGRRVWWYLTANDWMKAARFSEQGESVYQVHPRQMVVKKPRNINDVDLIDNKPQIEFPVSQPTEMTYFLLRIRMAEISRNIVDHSPMTGSRPSELDSYARIAAIDVDLDQLIHDIPPFLRLDSYSSENGPSLKTSNLLIQAYFLNSLIYMQRCKLHLAKLVSGPSEGSVEYATSREVCLTAARKIIRAELQIERAQHFFTQIRFRMPTTLYGLFMASIVLLMEVCVKSTSSRSDEVNRSQVAEALRIIERARDHSGAAANFHASLTQILDRYLARQQIQTSQVHAEFGPAGATISSRAAHDMNTMLAPTHQAHDTLAPAVNTAFSNSRIVDRNDHIGAMPEQQLSASHQSSYNMHVPYSLEELMNLDGLQWEDLFPVLDPSSPFPVYT
ncbi:hypothetical protein BX600DRAFT_437991 [Xylariales sp. PMI_506]|nr:hypothetical protein BX600DRAFT_437991 [Xylariales sp. PMI_506]